MLSPLMRYCLVQVALAFVVGIALARAKCLAIPNLLPWCAVATLLGVALLVRRRPCRRGLLLAAVVCLGLGRAVVHEAFPGWLLLRAPRLTEVSGTVVSYPSLGVDHTVFTLRPDVLPGDLRVTWLAPRSALFYGDRVRVVGSVRLPEAFDGFDYRDYLARRGVVATMLADGNGAVFREEGAPSLLRYGDRIRQSLLAKLGTVLGRAEVALAQGLLFGDRAALDEDVEEAFRRTGLMHVLAVSGLHLGIVLAGLWFALRRAHVRPLIAYPVVGLAVLAVLWIVGPRISLLRASLLFAFLGLGSVLADLGLILRRSIDPLNGLAAAALVLLALRPSQLADAGFQLSFCATAGILLVVSDRFLPRWGAVIEALARRAGPFHRPVHAALTLTVISAAAQAGVAPIVAWHFHTFHPALVAFNLTVLPLVTLALWTGLPGLLLLAVGASGAWIFPLSWSLQALSGAVRVLASIPLAELFVPRWTAVWLAALVSFAFATAAYSEESSWTRYSTSMTSGSVGPDVRSGGGRR